MAVGVPRKKENVSTSINTMAQKDKQTAKRAAQCRKGDRLKTKRKCLTAAIKVDSVGLSTICDQQDNFNFNGTHDKLTGHKWASTIYAEKKPKPKPKLNPNGRYGRVTGKSRSSFNNNGRKMNWRCDVCLKAFFEEYDDAVTNKNKCTNGNSRERRQRREEKE